MGVPRRVTVFCKVLSWNPSFLAFPLRAGPLPNQNQSVMTSHQAVVLLFLTLVMIVCVFFQPGCMSFLAPFRGKLHALHARSTKSYAHNCLKTVDCAFQVSSKNATTAFFRFVAYSFILQFVSGMEKFSKNFPRSPCLMAQVTYRRFRLELVSLLGVPVWFAYLAIEEVRFSRSPFVKERFALTLKVEFSYTAFCSSCWVMSRVEFRPMSFMSSSGIIARVVF